MRDPSTWYTEGDSIEAGSVEACARKITQKTLIRNRAGRRINAKRLEFEGTAHAAIAAQPAQGYVIDDALSAERIRTDADSVKLRKVTRGSSTHNIQRRGLSRSIYCVITRPLKAVRESS